MASRCPRRLTTRTRAGRRAALRDFLRVEAVGGCLLLVATVAALVWANSPVRDSYGTWWLGHHTASIGPWSITISPVHVVNDGFMVLFFFVIGLELKREWVVGELRDRRAAVLPAVAALGGMVVPALLYVLVNHGGDGAHGWGIPMATDIAFAFGVVTLLGSRVPASLKVFLLTLAIVDDVGAIVVIAIWYSSSLHWAWVGGALVALVAVGLLRRRRVTTGLPYILLGIVAWYATWRSGVHPTIAGVALGLLVPVRASSHAPAHPVTPDASSLEDRLHPWTSLVVVPLFALANAGVDLSGGFHGPGGDVLLGVGLGLLVGKPLGIVGATWLGVRLGLADAPREARWSQVLGVSLLAAIGFTMSLFVTGLAFDGSAAAHLSDRAVVGILLASTVAALVGSALLTRANRRAVST
ncbi:MAG TPA: Na+/H+ antiporter NhaA [Acidimicrobiales bacterium]|jgi:NhaA family Na+:H+ antiporter|nr:Na+/H+ antiporter NhaA [Acidimicrobiales bacterium]